MDKLIKPNFYYQDIYSINYQRLKDNNIHYLLLDIDNTIGDDKEKTPCKKAIDLISSLKKDFTIILFTNTYPARAKRYSKLLGIPYYAFSVKPLRMNYKKFLKDYKVNTDNVAAIGDQLYTDVLGANKMAITSILVDKISNNESLFTKLLRVRENNNIKKYNLIERGKYDD